MNSNELIPIKKLFDFEKGQLQSSKNTEGQYTFITAAQEWKTHESFTHDCEALIFAAAASGSLGRTHYYNGKFIASDLCFVLTPKEKYKNLIDIKFYHTIFNSLKEDIVKQTSTGTSKVSINKTNFGNYEIPLFDIDHQNSIKEKLEFTQPKKSTLDEELQTQSELINKLRSSILSDAVSGKLVPQDPNDESAEVLLEKIKAQKEKLIQEGKIKKQKPLPPISEDEIPYELPNGWVWCRLDDICRYIQRGKSPKYTEKNTRIPIIAQKCVQWKEIQMYKCQYLDLTKFETYTKERLLRNNDILWNSTGLGTLGRVNIFQHEKKYKIVVADSHVSVIRSIKKFIDSQYIYKFLLSPFVQNEIENKSSGSTKQSELGLNTIKNHLVPLPPLEEQKRIVEKVEKLMATCDALELEVQNSKAETEKLMQSVLKEAFKNGK